MRISNILVTLLFFCNHSLLFSQSFDLGDSLRVEFPKLHKVISVENENDLSFSIVVKNISNTPRKIYSTLVFDKSPTIFANYDCHLYKKVKDEYRRVDYYPLCSVYGYYFDSLYAIYGTKADSVLNLFDIAKKELLPFKSDTLSYNVLSVSGSLDPGEYKFKVYFRVGTVYSKVDNMLKVDQIKYINSDWYYFKINRTIKSLRIFQYLD